MRFLITKPFKKILKLIFFLRDSVQKRVNDFGAQYLAFGIFGILNYPIFYFIWVYSNQRSYENLKLRMTATILCGFLIAKEFWPKKLCSWFPLYWYFTLLFCLPFLFFFMLFKNNGANVWLMSTNTIIFWLILMVDWASYIYIFTLGVLLAGFCYLLTTTNPLINIYSWWGVTCQFIASFIVITFFAHNKRRFDSEKLRTISAISGSIAHELRTPLRAISSGAAGIRRCLPSLIETYKIAEQNNLEIPYLSPPLYRSLTPAFTSIEVEAQTAFTFIDMLLVKVNEAPIAVAQLEICSIKHCIQDALRRYPFDGEDEKLIHWDSSNDFSFRGKELLIVHVFFNLLKNAIYYIKAVHKGQINIWLEMGKKFNTVHFRDTGQGIAADILPRIFDRFYTKTNHGTGIGLAFCKLVMQGFEGDITCCSVMGEYTEFIIKFPKVT
jgi:signal transduction histidine kinase